MSLCFEVMEIEAWGKRDRITRCLRILRAYGAAARPMIARLRDLERQLKAHREARGLAKQIAEVGMTIEAIEKAPPGAPLRSLRD
jgi:hypothetical protein